MVYLLGSTTVQDDYLILQTEMKFKARLEQLDSSIWGQHIKLPKKVSDQFLADGSKRIICKVNDQFSFHGAIMPEGGGRYFVNFSKQNSKKYKLVEGQILDIELQKDESKYGIPMPEEFQELLYQDIEGDRLFHLLTPGKQRSLLHLIGKIKSPEIRIRKGLIIFNHLKSNHGKLDYKQLNEDFKNYKDTDFGF